MQGGYRKSCEPNFKEYIAIIIVLTLCGMMLQSSGKGCVPDLLCSDGEGMVTKYRAGEWRLSASM